MIRQEKVVFSSTSATNAVYLSLTARYLGGLGLGGGSVSSNLCLNHRSTGVMEAWVPCWPVAGGEQRDELTGWLAGWRSFEGEEERGSCLLPH